MKNQVGSFLGIDCKPSSESRVTQRLHLPRRGRGHFICPITVQRIVGASMTRDGAMQYLEVLSDRIGGRVTGSPESATAASLILKALSDAGLANAHTEQYPDPEWMETGPSDSKGG